MAFYCLDCRFRGNDTADPSIRLKCYKERRAFFKKSHLIGYASWSAKPHDVTS